ncbi:MULTISPECIES: hypothetical protein [unclassified Mycolicibacterium]|uniref:hypothetical protein n=1 Tax=unclassified Mycolicibacterium TaxID=2636767 RepID=UPI0012DE268C|nr:MULTISPECIES: hypothetical protein [unclassified Mycolicibacterium]MUL81776.1 hypothetical protein [Mycolicibacterium sp. CBMA 329]MUL87542.1 hypothetical protein [Mycolicibacterium sp. CBMA 331]MUL99594.1 hypothetical protein [Mycolicibacterium sp. CBMA 334]MUM26691.1 hypothetical protein [Mycolicibacterium sp. CBMA 295]MUM37839.1 hypothetical protein [Mycolicibacterium sp. CBMA 247]
MRNEIVAGISGLVVGHILWLTAITLATEGSRVNIWVLLVAALSFIGGAAGGYFGWRKYQEKSHTWAAFLWALPVSPVLFSLGLLGVTYL